MKIIKEIWIYIIEFRQRSLFKKRLEEMRKRDPFIY